MCVWVCNIYVCVHVFLFFIAKWILSRWEILNVTETKWIVWLKRICQSKINVERRIGESCERNVDAVLCPGTYFLLRTHKTQCSYTYNKYWFGSRTQCCLKWQAETISWLDSACVSHIHMRDGDFVSFNITHLYIQTSQHRAHTHIQPQL